jgi:ATP-dependent RNA helicase HelY
VLVLSQEPRRGSIRLLVLTASRQLTRLAPDDFEALPTPIAHVDLPVPYAPRSRAFQREAVEGLRRVKVRRPKRAAAGSDVAKLEAEVAAHPVARDPERDLRLRAAASVQRLERDLTRLERRVRGRGESLARQLDRVLEVLESWAYLDGWSLSEKGEMLAGLYTETDLVLAESLQEGLLDDLSVPETAAIASCFTYERRGSDGAHPAPPARWPSKKVAGRARDVERLWRSLVGDEDDAGLPETRPPDPGFTPFAFEWAAGDELSAILDDDELAGGDFVRHIKQCIDLLRQIGDVAPSPVTRQTARDAATACHRGVIAAGLGSP